MEKLLPLLLLIPLLGFLVSLFIPRSNERLQSGFVISTVVLYLAGFLAFTINWLLAGYPVLDIKFLPLYQTPDFEFIINFYFDTVTAVYLFVGAVITFTIVVFSKYYLHREEGFKRFFNTLLLFFLGFNLVVLSGNFETLFTGWEFVGISSFLLIAFYRDRYLPVKNAMKVVSVYRLGDIALILAMWMSHHFWHENITFLKLNDATAVATQLAAHPAAAVFISLMLVLAAATKSAQLPFSSWLPRAMEGPTTSTGIFYGSLSVSLGVFLLLRTYPFWESQVLIKTIVIVMGASTAVIATLIARVQPTVKTQIAYSSVAQLGIIFIEIALGLHVLALIHFAGNAFLRTYQLLVSPSVLNYLVHEQFYNFKPKATKAGSTFFGKPMQAIYILSIKEWNLDRFLYRSLWLPFKIIGGKLNFMVSRVGAILLALLFAAGIFIYIGKPDIPEKWFSALPLVYAVTATLLVLKAFTVRGSAVQSWLLVVAVQLFAGLAICLNAGFEPLQILLFLNGILLAAVAGFLTLRRLQKIEKNILLDQFHGNIYEHPKLGVIFLLSALGILGFPVTASFVGIDLFFTHIGHDQVALIILSAITIAFIELSVLRIYARLFLGQHKKTDHPIAFKSS